MATDLVEGRRRALRALRVRRDELRARVDELEADSVRRATSVGDGDDLRLLQLLTREQWGPSQQGSSTSLPPSAALEYYHALPLPDPDERLRCLQEFLPLLSVRSFESSDKDENQPGSTTSVTLCFGSLLLSLRWSVHKCRISHLQVLDVSPEAKLLLRQLITHCESNLNLSHLLLGCYEFARLSQYRESLWNLLSRSSRSWDTHSPSQDRIHISSRGQSQSLSVCIRYQIHFHTFPLPNSVLSTQLTNGSNPVPHANHICNALIREYGLQHGLLEFLRAVLT